MNRYLITGLALFLCGIAASAQSYVEKARFNAPDAKQAVAVDASHFYAITNTRITKYTMQGDSLMTWQEDDKEKVRHLNSGIVLGHRLYCANSNFPLYPMASSVEVFDTRTLRHIESIPFGIDTGSCTWVLPGKRCWYVFFAHYDKTDKATGEVIDNSNLAQLVQYDRKWRRMHAWILPSRLLEEIRPASLSGAVLIGDTFYCTGHDAPKCHLLRIPDTGFTLEWIGDIDVPFYGQGIARGRDGDLWGIIRSESAVIRSTR